MLEQISEYKFTKVLQGIANKTPYTFKGKLNINLISDLKFAVYGNQIMHLFDPTNTNSEVDTYYMFTEVRL